MADVLVWRPEPLGPRVTVRFSDGDLQEVDRIAAAKSCGRSDVIRSAVAAFIRPTKETT